MTVSTMLSTTLPALQPEDAGARLFLFGVRQIGMHGLHDACAAHSFVTAFGKDFQRPLVLLRALMQEMSAISSGPIQIAPWCCPRITGAEAALLEVMARVRTNPQSAAVLLADMLGVRDACGVLVTAHALANAFADLALPLGE
ncbi:DUF6628 family protein [Sphingomonas soli]|uniref:DUF6628 family protein n=1 Tax=Sphingomonas soli TaxID=266127 RepID=UPI00082FFE41|nr:DUF6628 family protein [Sphingomonas soli]